MPQPANLIFFQSDNHNRDLLGAYGHRIVQTPNLDNIAAAGVRFDNAYCSSSLCCPSRASLACGRYPHQTGYWDNCLVYDGRLPSWMRRIREQGHSCVSVGKLHFRSTEDDNGFSREIAPMHIVDGIGGLVMLLRWSDSEPQQPGQWQMYSTQSGVGGSDYQEYDKEISRLAIDWLNNEAAQQEKPWVLYVSYTSSHPPFSVPQRLYDRYPWQEMPLPRAFRSGERPEHPAYRHIRYIKGIPDLGSEHEDALRKTAAGYFGLITHLDEQIGSVMQAAADLGLLKNTRIMYTSDHGESYGHHGLMGKCQLLETAAAVPLLISGPGVPNGKTVQQIVSQVDLFPTIVAGVGARPVAAEDSALPGISLWPAIDDSEQERLGFAEYHASCSKTGSFMLRRGDDKLIYHVDMPAELYDLNNDPHELHDLLADGSGARRAQELEGLLREICDPERVNARCKADQQARVMAFGGNRAVRDRGIFVRTPPPGAAADMLKV
jgi:choline-sulfatase